MLRRFLALPAVLISLAVACGGGDGGNSGGGDGQPAPAVTQTVAPGGGGGGAGGSPEAALQVYVQTTQNKEFVALCSQAAVPGDAGKVCGSASLGERDGLRAYTIGLVASQFFEWVFLQNQGGQWKVAGTQRITQDNAGVPGIPWPLRTGVDVIVTGTGNGLNIRTGPGLNAAAVDRIDDGSVIRLSAGPAPADNLQWWQVEGRSGWVVSDYLRYPDATANPPRPAPSPAPAQPTATRVP